MSALAIRQLVKLCVPLQLLLLRLSRRPLSPSISILFARSTVANHSHRASDLRALPLVTLTLLPHDSVSIIRAFGSAWMCLPDPPPKMSLMAAQQRTVLSECGHAPAP